MSPFINTEWKLRIAPFISHLVSFVCVIRKLCWQYCAILTCACVVFVFSHRNFHVARCYIRSWANSAKWQQSVLPFLFFRLTNWTSPTFLTMTCMSICGITADQVPLTFQSEIPTLGDWSCGKSQTRKIWVIMETHRFGDPAVMHGYFQCFTLNWLIRCSQMFAGNGGGYIDTIIHFNTDVVRKIWVRGWINKKPADIMVGPAQFAWMRVWLSAPTSLPHYPPSAPPPSPSPSVPTPPPSHPSLPPYIGGCRRCGGGRRRCGSPWVPPLLAGGGDVIILWDRQRSESLPFTHSEQRLYVFSPPLPNLPTS